MTQINYQRLLFATLMVVFLWPSLCSAQDEFYFGEDPIHGSFKLEYGGLYKVAVEHTTKLYRAYWLDQEELRYDNGLITYTELLKNNQKIRLNMKEWENGTPWYYRRWWHSFPEAKGGAPKKPRIIRYGRTRILVDLGFIYFTTALELKWRGLELAVDFKKKSSITLGVGSQVAKPRSGWKFKLYPNVRITTRRLFSTPLKSVRRADLNIGGIHTIRGRDIVALIFNTWYNFEENGLFFGLQISLLQW